MMDMIGGLFGAAGSIAGGIMGAEASDYAADTNWNINLLNYQQRERERAQAIAMANKLRAEQKLGSTDIRGTRTHFVPGQGWVVEGSPEVLQMIKLQEDEQKKKLTIDMPQRRAVMARNYARGLQDEALADTFKRQLQNRFVRSDEGIAGDLYKAQAMGLREASGDAGRRAFTQSARTGNTNVRDVATGLQRADNEAYAKAALTAKMMARGLGDKEANERQNNLANLYNMFATRAGQLTDVGYKPEAIDTNGQLNTAQSGLLQAGQGAVNAAALKGGSLDYIQPNYGWANAVGGAGSALGSMFRAQAAKDAYGGGSSGGGVGGFGGSGGGGGSSDDYLSNETGGW